ncbi:MAG: RluA family pseudouridine synthase [Planctomycetota bacterium]|nr:RluA family pseudouridine synthase [Planctomycetota bacterium]
MTDALPEILHRDERIIVLNKPAGLLSVPGIGPEKADCLAARIAAALPGARIVHRLDRDTSGVIVMALDAEAHRQLSVQFQDRLVEKKYIAIAAGVIEREEGSIDLPLRKDLDDPPRQIIDHEHGRPAVTRWRVLERGTDRTRVELSPRTGRSHQLRLHLKTLGHPVLGDDLYAPPDVLAMADRLMLHALSLSIVHPATADLRTFQAPCPF